MHEDLVEQGELEPWWMKTYLAGAAMCPMACFGGRAPHSARDTMWGHDPDPDPEMSTSHILRLKESPGTCCVKVGAAKESKG